MRAKEFLNCRAGISLIQHFAIQFIQHQDGQSRRGWRAAIQRRFRLSLVAFAFDENRNIGPLFRRFERGNALTYAVFQQRKVRLRQISDQLPGAIRDHHIQHYQACCATECRFFLRRGLLS